MGLHGNARKCTEMHGNARKCTAGQLGKVDVRAGRGVGAWGRTAPSADRTTNCERERSRKWTGVGGCHASGRGVSWPAIRPLSARFSMARSKAPSIVELPLDKIRLNGGTQMRATIDQHGLRRSNGDKRKAVMALFTDKDWARWSNRQIARQCQVSYALVAVLRQATEGPEPDPNRRRLSLRGDRLVSQPAEHAQPARPPANGQAALGNGRSETIFCPHCGKSFLLAWAHAGVCARGHAARRSIPRRRDLCLTVLQIEVHRSREGFPDEPISTTTKLRPIRWIS
jgi:hypothetical protein